MAFRERFKDAALDVGLGRKYGHTGDDTQDCVRLLYAILVVVYGSVMVGIRAEMMLNVPDGLGSAKNCAALVHSQLAAWVQAPAEPGIYYCQGWRGNKGHAFALIVYPTPMAGEWLWILEATNGTDDWYRPVTWSEVQGKWPNLTIVQLLES